ncbi:hypothetical protein [Actinocorallia aurantiaca]|uniref:Uncharacterized protein n=1 Tax=Actinocorallia aurantiaca TaxID=46204 RepID=A0ABN3UE89_9ACTN
MPHLPPNPHSPYATADPAYRHLIPGLFGVPPVPGTLCRTACGSMAVAPSDLARDVAAALEELSLGRSAELPEGLCPACVTVATTGSRPARAELSRCGGCGGNTGHGDLCARCRQERHDEWRSAGP